MNRFDDIIPTELPLHALLEEASLWAPELCLAVELRYCDTTSALYGLLTHEGKTIAELTRDIDDFGWELSYVAGGKLRRAALKALREALEARNDAVEAEVVESVELYVNAYSDLLDAIRRRVAKLNVGRGVQGPYRVLTPVPEPEQFFCKAWAVVVCLNGVVVFEVACTDGIGYELRVRSEGGAFDGVVESADSAFVVRHQRLFERVV